MHKANMSLWSFKATFWPTSTTLTVKKNSIKYTSLLILLTIPTFLYSADNEIKIKTFTRENTENGQLFKMTGTQFDEIFEAKLTIEGESYSAESTSKTFFGSSGGTLKDLEMMTHVDHLSIEAFMYKNREQAYDKDTVTVKPAK